MKHNIKNFLFIAVAVVFVCSATIVFASSSTSFPNDPRENPLPAGVRATAPINASGSDSIPTNRSLPESFNNYLQDNSPDQGNNLKKNSIVSIIIPLLLAFIVICFLAIIFFAARG